VADGIGALVAVGGDGTVHRAVQAVAGTGIGFGVVPAGTGNDFAAGTGVPAEPLTAATVVADAVRDGHLPKLSVEKLDGEPVIGSGHEESLVGAGFSRGPRKLTASA